MKYLIIKINMFDEASLIHACNSWREIQTFLNKSETRLSWTDKHKNKYYIIENRLI